MEIAIINSESGIVTIDPGTKIIPSVEKTIAAVIQFDFTCRIYGHKDNQSGKSSDDASAALGLSKEQVIKCLYVTVGNTLSYGVILSGNSMLDFKLLAAVLGTSKSKLHLSKPDKAELDTGYQYGGIPVTAFKDKGISAFVDQNVLKQNKVTASGGSEFHAMEFDPIQLIDKLGYTVCKIS